MYIVHMKRYTVAQARRELASVLDAAERGEGVVIERRGTLFALEARRAPHGRARRRLIESIDPALESGAWSFSYTAGSPRLRTRGSPAPAGGRDEARGWRCP